MAEKAHIYVGLKKVLVPNYVLEVFKDSELYLGPGCDPGYSLAVHKESCYKMHYTQRARLERAVNWLNKQYAFDDGALIVAKLVYTPDKTHHCDQLSHLIVYDPPMQFLEKYISANAIWRWGKTNRKYVTSL